MRLHRARAVATLTLTITMIPGITARVGAQERLGGYRASVLAPVFETWTFDGGIAQPSTGGSVTVRRVTQWSVPLTVAIPLGSRWTVDVSGAYASGAVELADRDAGAASARYVLDGLTDVRMRLVGQLIGDDLLVTLGATAPTGTTSLDPEQMAALEVLAAPGLRMQSPALGTGAGGTAGLVLAHQIRGWAWALATSYEHRGSYAPIAALVAGAPSPTMEPGPVLHASLGTDGLIGQHGMTLSVSADLYSDDTFTSGAVGAPTSETVVRLGPAFTAEWQLRVAARAVRELTLWVADHYRTPYELNGEEVEGSSGNQLEGGVRAIVPLGRTAGLLIGLDGRRHSGLRVDETLATAAFAGAGATLGVDIARGGRALRVFARAQRGRFESGDAEATARGLLGGIALSQRF